MKSVLEEYGAFIVEIICALAIFALFGTTLHAFSDFGEFIAGIVMGGA